METQVESFLPDHLAVNVRAKNSGVEIQIRAHGLAGTRDEESGLIGL